MADEQRTRWPWQGAVAQPSCGACGYPVQGLPSFTCPECGKDLRQVGIITPRQDALVSLWRVAKAHASAVGTLGRAVGRVVGLKPPVISLRTTLEIRGDGRVVFDPSVVLPPGRHAVVLVIQSASAGEKDGKAGG
jgi:hypothetical protein